MKRSTVAALLIGALVSAAVIVLRVKGILRPLEDALASLFSGGFLPSKVVAGGLHYVLVVLLSFGLAWLILSSTRRKRLGWPIALLAVELLVVVWVGLLYQFFFQPLPSLLALGLSFAAANGYAAFAGKSRSSIAKDYFRERLSDEQYTRIASGDLPFTPEAKSYEATAVVCDIANKHDLAEECPPALFAEITERFIGHATESFLKAGAYIETVTGEGIVAVFGFPAPDPEQAEKATRHALALLQDFEKLRENSRHEGFKKCGVHLGISSGTMIFAPLQQDGRGGLLATGEPVELARRFCIANRFYGSRVLIGPQTFELASKAVVARPIDFLSGVDVRERHEIYEPLMLAGDATPEQLARRDSFWNGVVLYREKRWGEAYSQFQKARGPNEYDDAPLQLYLRRIEPLALQLIDAP